MSSLSRPLNSLFDSVARSKGAGILFADEAETCSGEVAEDTVNRLAGGLSALGAQGNARVAFLQTMEKSDSASFRDVMDPILAWYKKLLQVKLTSGNNMICPSA